MIDKSKAFEVENGVILNEGGSGLFTGFDAPIGKAAPLNSLYMRSNGETWFKYGSGNDDWLLLNVGDRGTQTQLVEYTNGLPTTITLFRNATQTTPNRYAMVVISYTDGTPTSETTTVYDTDGTTVLKALTNSYTFSGIDLTNISEAIT